MKLSKDVCRKCVNDYARVRYIGQDKNLKMNFCEIDESSWDKEGVVQCPHHDGWEVVSIKDTPKGCPKKFEHSVAAGMNHVK